MKQFNTTISAFNNMYDKPSDIILYDWLLTLKKPKNIIQERQRNICLKIRKTTCEKKQKELKSKLSAACPSGRVVGGRRKENVISRSGFMQFDLDHGENCHIVQQGESLRDQIANLNEVAFCGVSTRGKGVWGLVKVSDPDDYEAHFRQLVEDFKTYGINLDTSKGANANDLRYYSYDPNAIIKDNFTIYDRKLAPKENVQKAPKFHSTNCSSDDPYGKLKYCCTMIENASKGGRHNTIYKAARLAGGYIESGVIPSEDVAISELTTSADSINPDEKDKNRSTVIDGIDNGKSSAIYLY